MNKPNNYLIIILIFVFFLITNCSFFKDEKEEVTRTNTNYFVETVAKPDPSLKGIKVSLRKSAIHLELPKLTPVI